MSMDFYLVCDRCKVYGPYLGSFGKGGASDPQGRFIGDHYYHQDGLRFATEYEVDAERLISWDEDGS